MKPKPVVERMPESGWCEDQDLVLGQNDLTYDTVECSLYIGEPPELAAGYWIISCGLIL